MSHPCVLCGGVALYRNGNRGYCKKHKAEATQDRMKSCKLMDKLEVVKNPHRSFVIDNFYESLRNKKKKREADKEGSAITSV